MPEVGHISVLKEEVLSFVPQDCKVMVDGTLGLGGHAISILENRALERYIAFDKDAENFQKAQERLKKWAGKLTLHRRGFEDMVKVVAESSVDCVLLDLGLASTQVDQAERGFSFRQEGPLDMRFDKSQKLTAELIVNSWREEDLKQIFQDYGEERFAGRVARAIVHKRPFKTTTDLAAVVSEAKPGRGKIHPATQVFQALRIAVNSELEVLPQVLETAQKLLRKNGRLIVISYHSLEDRIVKNFLRDRAKRCICPPEVAKCVCQGPTMRLLTRKPVVPGEAEIVANLRARSAKMRVAEKII